MSRTPTVSLVMPAYNAAHTIGTAVSSVLTQTLPDVELIVVDDGSTDHTADIVRAVAPAAVLLRQDNSGVGAARARGIAAAQAPLIAFCDADDMLFDRHLEALVAALQDGGPRCFATANAYWWFPGGIDHRRQRHRGRFPAAGEQRRSILQANFVSTMSLFPRAMIDEIGSVDPDLRRGEDWDLWIRAVFAGWTVVHQPRPLALYRRNGSGLSEDTAAFAVAERQVLQRVSARDDLSAAERKVLDERLAHPRPTDLADSADAALAAGRFREAARLYRTAARLMPDETPLVAKSRAMRAAPWLVGPLLRARDRRRSDRLGPGGSAT